ncbi:MAG: hypothetical protein V1780_00515 [Chloroflexota bacterium]
MVGEEKAKVTVLVRRPEAAQEEAPGPESPLEEEAEEAAVWQIPRRWRVD